MTGREVARQFANGKGGDSLNLHGFESGIYSYQTPMALRRGKEVLVNPKKYSVTTSKHQTYIREELRFAGLRPTGKKARGGCGWWKVTGWEIWR